MAALITIAAVLEVGVQSAHSYIDGHLLPLASWISFCFVEFENWSSYVSAVMLSAYTRVGTLIVATIYLQLIQNRYMFRSFTVL